MTEPKSLQQQHPEAETDEHLRQQVLRLRNEIDRLRLENQSLRVELHRVSDWRHLTYKTVRSRVRHILHRVRRVKGKVAGRSVESNPVLDQSTSPYQVQILKSLQPKRPRVLHVIGNFYTGGSARLVVDLVERLGHRFEQEVITRDIPDSPAYVGLKVHHYKQFGHLRQVIPILKTFKPDLIHVHYLGHHRDEYSELDWKWYSSVFQAAEECGCRVIENINIPTEPYISESVSSYVYVSNFVREEFGQLNAPNRTIYPGSDFALFSRREGITAPSDCIGMVYRLEGDKLNERSLDAFVKVVERRPNTTALIVGGGRYLEHYRSLAQQAGVSDAFTFTNYLPYEELPRLYERMSIFVAPVHSESFGQVTPFAMSMGIPVVGYDVGALKEITGAEDLLAPAQDSDALAEIIIDLLDDRQRQLKIGDVNRQRARQLFSVESMINSYSDLYDKTIQTTVFN